MSASLQRRLTATQLALLAPLVLALAVALDWFVSSVLRRQFDESLAGRARDFATMLEREPTRFEFEFDERLIPEYATQRGGAYFQVWLRDGGELVRSRSLVGAGDLPRPRAGTLDEPVFEDLILPDGRPGRLAGFVFLPRVEEDIDPAEAATYRDELVVAVAHDVQSLQHTLARLRWALWSTFGAFAALAVAGASWSIRRGLRPLERVNAEIDAVDEHNLSARIDLSRVPSDLRPPLRRLNTLLDRLEASFVRERRFAADAGHELRTPLAATRSVLEVALSRPRDAEAYREAAAEALELVVQLSELAETLLALASAEAEQLAIDERPVSLNPLVDECWSTVESVAARRRIAFTNEIAPDTVLASDPVLVRRILVNLLSNAARYAEPDGHVVVRGGDDGVVLEVWQSGPPLDADTLAHGFDRFWRGDASRREAGTHVGLGLSLANELARRMGCELTARNPDDGGASFTLLRRSRPGARS